MDRLISSRPAGETVLTFNRRNGKPPRKVKVILNHKNLKKLERLWMSVTGGRPFEMDEFFFKGFTPTKFDSLLVTCGVKEGDGAVTEDLIEKWVRQDRAHFKGNWPSVQKAAALYFEMPEMLKRIDDLAALELKDDEDDDDDEDGEGNEKSPE